MGRIKGSFAIMKASWQVLRQDRELLWLPVMSFAFTIIVGGIAAVAILLVSSGGDADDGLVFGVPGYLLAFAAWIVLGVASMFFRGAVVAGANERMTGGDPSVGSAIAGARAHFGPIALWGIVTATVSQVIRMIQERFGIVGAILGGLAGLAWALVTFLVLPVLIIEGVGVGEALKRSKDLFKRTWGEQVVGNAAIGIATFLLVLAALPVLLLTAVTGSAAVMIVGVLLFVGWVAALAVVSAALSGIFQTALYHYATTGMIPTGYTQEHFQLAFRAKPDRRGRFS